MSLYKNQFVATSQMPDPGIPGSTEALSVTPALGRWIGRSPFRARRWLRGGHVQTIASFLLPRKINLPAAEERLVEVAPGIKVRCWCYWQTERSAALTVFVVHGLEGSSDSQYMRGIARNALAAGMNAVLMNQRNCGGMDHCAPT